MAECKRLIAAWKEPDKTAAWYEKPLINYKEQTGLIIDISVPRDENIQDKELEKVDKYQSLKIELEQLWNLKILMIQKFVGAVSAITDRLPG